VSHQSGHVIITLALPHHDDEEGGKDANRLRREPSVFVNAPGECSEDECAELARLAYRKLIQRN
jgi:hypothetical protein